MLLSLLRLNMSMLMVMVFAAVFFFLLIPTAVAGAGKRNPRSLVLGLIVFLIVGGLLFLFVGHFVVRTVDVQREMPAAGSAPIGISHSMPALPAAPAVPAIEAQATVHRQRHAVGLGGLGVIEVVVLGGVLLLLAAILSRRGAPWSPGMKAGVVLLILVIAAFPLGFMLLSRQRVEVARQHQARQIAEVDAAREEALWNQAVTEQFEADVYPSREEAIRALARQFDEIAAQVTGDWKNATIYDREGFTADLVKEFRQALWEYHQVQPRWERWQVDSLMVPHIVLRLEFVEMRRKNVNDLYEEGGRIVMTLSAEGREATADARFVHKLWLADLAEVQGFYDGELEVVRSGETATSVQEARSQVLGRAVTRVADLVSRRVRQSPGVPGALAGSFTVTPADLQQHGIELDSFAQQLQGSASPICRYAVLLDTSPEKIASLADAKVGAVASRAESWAQLVVKFVGMALLIAAVYFFLNTATRGYYVWSLRIAAVVLLAAGILLVLNLA